MIIQIIILFALILLNACFAMSEISIVTRTDKKIKRMAANGHQGAIKVLKLTENSNDFLATIQVGVTLSGFLTSASASMSFSGVLADALSFLPVPRHAVEVMSTVIITLILSYFSLVLGELVPKKIAMQHAETVSFKVVGILLAIAAVFKPFIALLSHSMNLVVKLIGFNPNASEQVVTEEEILMLVDAGEEKGMIEEQAKDMIANIFEFDNTTVDEIMTHRTDLVAVEENSNLYEVAQVSIKEGRSRIPVYKDDFDNIIGVIYVKDLLKYIGKASLSEVKITDIMRSIAYVPGSKRCNELFREFTALKRHIAVVVDEYGGTEGIVTMEDLVESIVGNIQDEYDNEEEEIRRINDNTFTVDGTTLLYEIENLTGIKIPSGDYDTISGYIVDKLGKIPKKGEHESVEVGKVKFTVQEVTQRRISKIQVEIQSDALPENS